MLSSPSTLKRLLQRYRAETLRASPSREASLEAYDAIIAEHSESVVAKSGRAEL